MAQDDVTHGGSAGGNKANSLRVHRRAAQATQQTNASGRHGNLTDSEAMRLYIQQRQTKVKKQPGHRPSEPPAPTQEENGHHHSDPYSHMNLKPTQEYSTSLDNRYATEKAYQRGHVLNTVAKEHSMGMAGDINLMLSRGRH